MQGPLKAPIKAMFLRSFSDVSGPYEPIKAHMGQAQALEEQERFRNNAPFVFFRNTFFSKIVVVDLQTTFC